MTSPKTARVTLEVTNDDGSKTVIQTEDLDASKLPTNRASREGDVSHLLLGMKDPFRDPENWFDRRERWVDELLCVPRFESHFFLNLQLEPTDLNKVYTISYIEAPATRVIMFYNEGTGKLQVTEWNEKDLIPDSWLRDSIYFFLDIP